MLPQIQGTQIKIYVYNCKKLQSEPESEPVRFNLLWSKSTSSDRLRNTAFTIFLKINQAFATVFSKFSFSFKNSFSDIAGIALHSQGTQEENIHRIFLLSLPIEEEWKEKQRQRSLRPEFALAVLPRLISKERLNSSYSSKSTEAKQLAWQGIEYILDLKQTHLCLTVNTFICRRKSQIMLKEKTTFKKCANVGRGKCAKNWWQNPRKSKQFS